MDELTLLRRMHDDVPAPAPDVLAETRTRLLARAMTAQAGEPQATARPARSRARTVGVRFAMAAAVAAGLVGTDVVVAGQPWLASAEASTITSNAVAATGRAGDLVPAPGQYLHRTLVHTIPSIPKWRAVKELWILADPNGTWVRRTHNTNGGGVVVKPETVTARGGKFEVYDPEITATGPRNWEYPDTAFLQALPKDPLVSRV